MKTKVEIHYIGWIVLLIVLIAYVLTAFFSMHTRRILAAMMVAVGVVAFYGLIGLGVGGKDNNLSKPDIRLAIVGAIITVYLALIGTVSTFAPRLNETGSEYLKSPEITTSLVTHFTTIVGVVIVFYFGTVAFETVSKYKTTESGEKPNSTQPEEDKNSD